MPVLSGKWQKGYIMDFKKLALQAAITLAIIAIANRVEPVRKLVQG